MALEQALMAIKTLHLSGVPLLSSCADCELSACLVCREEAGISPRTFSKCHKEGEMHSCNFLLLSKHHNSVEKCMNCALL